nr:MAG TPA: hypothetical protein [Caudoviricetes sp.]
MVGKKERGDIWSDIWGDKKQYTKTKRFVWGDIWSDKKTVFLKAFLYEYSFFVPCFLSFINYCRG